MRFFLGALLLWAAPLFSQMPELSGLQLNEAPGEVRKALGFPALVADLNPEFVSWQYQIGVADHDEFSHALVFRKSLNNLVSISRSFDIPINVEPMFPAGETTYHRYPKAGDAQLTVRLRRLTGDRLLMAMGSAKPGDPTTQLILIHRSVLSIFYPWLAAELGRTISPSVAIPEEPVRLRGSSRPAARSVRPSAR